jgi:HK97 family phage major capsid protein
MATSREILERTVRDMRALNERAGNAPTADQAAELKSMADNVQHLTEQLTVEAQRNGNVGVTNAFIGDLAGTPSTVDAPTVTKTSGRTVGGPSLAFADDDLELLRKSALDRHVNSKASLSTTEVPQAGIGDYRTNVNYPAPYESTRILNLVQSEATQSPTIFYYRTTTGATAAAPVAQNAPKPESSPVFAQVAAPVEKIAHWLRAADELLADLPSFRDLISNELIGGLINAENAQLLNGTGISPNLRGILNTVGIQTVGSLGTDLDAVMAAANQIRVNAFVQPDTVVINPNDWSSSGFAKDSTGRYMLDSPHDQVVPKLWGMNVVQSTQMTENTLLVGCFREGVRAFVRQPPTVEVHPYGGGTAEFTANQTLIRCEERLSITVPRPLCFCTVTAV